MTDDGDYLVPDKRFCYFHKHIGEQVVRDAAVAAIHAAGLVIRRGYGRKSKKMVS